MYVRKKINYIEILVNGTAFHIQSSEVIKAQNHVINKDH